MRVTFELFGLLAPSVREKFCQLTFKVLNYRTDGSAMLIRD